MTKEEQLRALRELKFFKSVTAPVTDVTKPVTDVTPPVTRNCPDCERYAAEVKRLKLELAKRVAEPVPAKERMRRYRERKRGSAA